MENPETPEKGGLLILMRHGDYTVASDGHKRLNEKGIAAAETSGRYISETLGLREADVIFSSDAERAVETADIVARHVRAARREQDAALRPGGSGIAELVMQEYSRKNVIIVTHIPVIELQYAAFLNRNAFFSYSPAALTALRYIPGKQCYEMIASYAP